MTHVCSFIISALITSCALLSSTASTALSLSLSACCWRCCSWTAVLACSLLATSSKLSIFLNPSRAFSLSTSTIYNDQQRAKQSTHRINRQLINTTAEHLKENHSITDQLTSAIQSLHQEREVVTSRCSQLEEVVREMETMQLWTEWVIECTYLQPMVCYVATYTYTPTCILNS